MRHCKVCDKELTEQNSTQYPGKCDACYEREYDRWTEEVEEARDLS